MKYEKRFDVSPSVTAHLDLAHAISVGTPPFLRLGTERSGRVTTQGADAAQRWLHAATSNGRTSAKLALGVRGLSTDDLEMAFSADSLPHHGSPLWIDDLLTFIDELSATRLIADEGLESAFVGANAFLPAAMRLLNWDALTQQFAFLDGGLINTLTNQLSLRLIVGCAAVLELEASYSAASWWDFGRDAWIERLCHFPALTYVLGTAVRQWRQATTEMILRLASDLTLLREQAFLHTGLSKLVDLEADLGDRHNDGRSVAVLRFDDGSRIVYKPKDGGAAAIFHTLIDDFLPSTSRGYRAVERNGYHWESYVAQSSVADPADVRQFFAHYGGLVRLVQLLEGRDFWIDNLRVDGTTPRFVDSECILQPRVSDAGFVVTLPNFEMDRDTYEESVLASAAVTQPIVIDGVGKHDFGGLSGPGVRALPLGMWSGYGDRQNGNIWVRDGRMFWRPDIAWPVVDGMPAQPKEYLPELENGYRACQSQLLVRGERLLASTAPLANAGETQVRVLLRNTWEYLVLLRASTEPCALLDANSREIVLAHVIGSAPRWGMPQDDERRAQIAWNEVDAIRSLDVPLFLSHPGGSNVHTGNGLIAEDVFSNSAIERLVKRIALLPEFDTDVQVEVLKLAVEMMSRADRE